MRRVLDANLGRLAGPNETLETAYRRELQALQDARRGVAGVLASEKRLELEASALAEVAQRASVSATSALAVFDEAAARREVAREAAALAQRERFLDVAAAIRVQRIALEAFAERIRERVDRVRSEKLARGVRLAVARATSRASEGVERDGDHRNDAAYVVERAQEAMRDAQARLASIPRASDACIEARVAALRCELALPKLEGPSP